MTGALAARVHPDVAGLDKHFDYAVPAELVAELAIGSRVRVDLHGRRIGGWVTELLPASDAGGGAPALKPIAKLTGHGPPGALIELAAWAQHRWAARSIRPFLRAASPPRAVRRLPAPQHTAVELERTSPATADLLAAGGGVLRLPPRTDVLPAILSAVALGPALVVVPGLGAITSLRRRLRALGLSVAAVPDEWADAAAGVDVVIGTRVAAWAPCPGMAAAVLVDEHDEAHQEERTPTWHARDVLVERCRRSAVPSVLVSPAPTLVAIEEHAGGEERVVHPPRRRERAGWPQLTVVDRSGDEPWRRSLLTSPLIERLRDHQLGVACISNITGRARVLACRACRHLIRCEHCDAAVALDDGDELVCRRCDTRRPPVCQACGASAFANLRPGVTRLREELEKAANRPVVSVTGKDEHRPEPGGVSVGTEALLHRLDAVDVVVFLEFDSELLAPRFRAGEQALALIVRAGRAAPEVMVQTFVPDHEVLRAAATGDPSIVAAAARRRRRPLALPPYGALAEVAGAGAAAVIDQLDRDELRIGRDGDDRYLVRAADWQRLGDALAVVERPHGTRVRIAVDPPRA